MVFHLITTRNMQSRIYRCCFFLNIFFRLAMRFKGVLFDLDGTLLNTLDDLASSGNAALISLGYPAHTRDAYRYFVGDGMRTLIERIMPPFSKGKLIDECEKKFRSHYAEHWNDKTHLYPGIAAMLEDLSNLDLQLAVLSNKPDDFTQKCVRRFFPNVPFACVQGQLNAVPKKPHPQGALIVAQNIGVPPADILYVGDTATDMRTGKSAGMIAVGVQWGFREIRELKENGADFIAMHPQEIVDLCCQK